MDASETIIINLYNWAINFYHSAFFGILKILIGIYTAVILIDIVLLLVQRGVSGDLRDTLLGMNIPGELVTKRGKAKLIKKWRKIKGRLDSREEDQYKVALIEADRLIDNFLRRMGFSGENMTERLESIPLGQLEISPQLLEAHKVHNRIIHEENFRLTREEAKKTLHLYEEFLKYHMVLH